MNVAAHQEKEKNEETGKRKAGEGKDRRLVLKKLRAALLQSLREQHGKNGLSEGSARSKWDSWEGQQPL